MPVTPNPFLGIGFHAVGATCASTCYTPQKKVQGWSWQTYWITQASFCWFILPIVGALVFIPHLKDVLAEAPRSAMYWAFILGAVYGIGGTAFGIAIRYIGFSLTYAIAVGLSAVLGTLIPPVAKGTYNEIVTHPGLGFSHYLSTGFHQLSDIADKTGGGWVLSGVAVGALGIAFCGWAGHSKEQDLGAAAKASGFSLTKGLLISILAGFLSAVYGFALDAGQPIADVADKHGADIYQGLVIYPFSNTGAFITTAFYCLYLSLKQKTFGEFLKAEAPVSGGRTGGFPVDVKSVTPPDLVELPAGELQSTLPMNFTMAFLTGCLWYGQFFFYNFGHVRMGSYKFSSWAIHMIMLVLISALVGILLREWKGVRGFTQQKLALALAVLVGAVCLLTYGNKLGEAAATPPSPPAPAAPAAAPSGAPGGPIAIPGGGSAATGAATHPATGPATAP